MKSQRQSAPFKTIDRAGIPNGRKGKHHDIIGRILQDLESLPEGRALKIPLADLSDSKANIRSALNRATHKHRKNVATAADDEFLYVWNT